MARTGAPACSGARRRRAPGNWPLRCPPRRAGAAPSRTGWCTGSRPASPAWGRAGRRRARRQRLRPARLWRPVPAARRRAPLPPRGPRARHPAGSGRGREKVRSGVTHQRTRARQRRAGRHLPARLIGSRPAPASPIRGHVRSRWHAAPPCDACAQPAGAAGKAAGRRRGWRTWRGRCWRAGRW